MRQVLYLVMAGMLLMSGPLGCASRHATTIKTEERVQRPGVMVGTEGVGVGTKTTTTVAHTPQESRGVLSTTVHFLGEVISWPFRLVGALVRALF
ncbi:MAG: hypothetical protein COV75_02835 [Candidatus Omnitrophica bacterium CG11_big_fil_rev_8_21_14_0_20_63_9]|nr:MAG: hypothetical protein COV75_02835 [Candidatus Omnitrophica bacterium CG11_big_fil_rev_8_21_14_0_20_63_9]